MINIAQYIRRQFDPPEFYAHVFGKSGGSSKHMLEKFTAAKDDDMMCYSKSFLKDESKWRRTFQDIFHSLENYGPALVSNFTVTEEFNNDKISSHQGPIVDIATYRKRNKHAMVLVGARLDNLNNGWFLLQNWCSKKQFVEVDFQWLKDSGASLVFVLSMKVPELTGQFSQNRLGGGCAQTSEGFERSDGGGPPKSVFPLED